MSWSVQTGTGMPLGVLKAPEHLSASFQAGKRGFFFPVCLGLSQFWSGLAGPAQPLLVCSNRGIPKRWLVMGMVSLEWM